MPPETASFSTREFFPLKYYFLCQANTYFCLDHLLVLLLPFDTAGESLIVLPQNDFSPYLKTIINLLAPWSVFCITNPSSDNFSRIEFEFSYDSGCFLDNTNFFNGSICFGMNTGFGIRWLGIYFGILSKSITPMGPPCSPPRKYGQK